MQSYRRLTFAVTVFLYIRDNNYDNHFIETFIAQNRNNCSSIVAYDLELNCFHVYTIEYEFYYINIIDVKNIQVYMKDIGWKCV